MNSKFFAKIVLVFSILAIFISSCRRDERAIVGTWDLVEMRTIPTDNSAEPDTLMPQYEETYIFSPDGTYTVDRIVERNNEEELVVSRGNWEMSTNNEEDEEVNLLRLREKQLTRIIEQVYQIEQLEEDSLIWNDRRRLKYIFRRAED